MMLIMSIILMVVAAGFAMTTIRILNGTIAVRGVASSIGFGMITGAINFVSAKVAGGSAGWIAIILFIIALAVIASLAFFALRDAATLAEFGLFAILELIMFFVARTAASAICELFPNAIFWKSIVMLIPTICLVIVIGAFLINFCLFRYRNNMGDGWRIGGIIAAIAMAIAMILLLIFVPKWGEIKAETSTTETETATLTDEEEASLNEQAENIAKVLSLSDSEFEEILEMSSLKGATLLRSSLPSKKSDRLFEDAISTPLAGTTADEMTDSLEDELRNPVWLCARFERLAESELPNGKKMSEYYPALTAYVELFRANGIEYFITNEADENGEFPLTTEYLRYAVIGELLFDGATAEIKKDVDTKYVWRLDEEGVYGADGSFDLSKLDAVKQEYQESEEYDDVIVLTHYLKSGAVAYVEYFDIYDRAPVIPDTEPEPTTTPETTAPETTTGGGGGDNPTPNPEPEPEPETTYNKDKTQGTQGDLVAPNDNPGPGEDTNNGVGAQYSTKDQSDNSNHMTYDEYVEKIENLEQINEVQQTGDGGTADIDQPTNITTPAKTSTGEEINTEPAGAWGGPAD